jgi:hypothetical protein
VESLVCGGGDHPYEATEVTLVLFVPFNSEQTFFPLKYSPDKISLFSV